ncbi:HU family DNA-binding protein [Gammaproteobacteria bacterium]|nr:HU family DNA-binding protein [Gammaproteobacteria bacterium]
MNFNKSNIIKKINKNSSISNDDSSILLELFLLFIKNHSKLSVVKLSGFGTFSFKKTPERVGRNPKTNDSYIIPTMNKLNFKPSNKIKDQIN